MRKNINENFCEYAIKWIKQAARVKSPIKEFERIDVYLQAQEPDFFHYLLSVVGRHSLKLLRLVKWWKMISSQ